MTVRLRIMQPALRNKALSADDSQNNSQGGQRGNGTGGIVNNDSPVYRRNKVICSITATRHQQAQNRCNLLHFRHVVQNFGNRQKIFCTTACQKTQEMRPFKLRILAACLKIGRKVLRKRAENAASCIDFGLTDGGWR